MIGMMMMVMMTKPMILTSPFDPTPNFKSKFNNCSFNEEKKNDSHPENSLDIFGK